MGVRNNMTLSIVLIAVLGVGSVSCGKKSTDQGQESDEAKEKSNADSIRHQLERGQYLALHVAGCLYCHSQRDYNFFSGPIISGTEGVGGQKFDRYFRGIPGEVYSRNITPAKLGTWSNEEVLRAITQGISQNGDTLYPLMPYPHFSRMAKDDALSIVAYLRTLPSIPNEVPPRKLRVSLRSVMPSFPENKLDQNSRPPYAEREKYGEYILTIAACMDCHTPMEKSQLLVERAFSGGQEFRVNGFTVRSANITPDSTTGIGTWTEEVFLTKFTQYRTADGYQYNPGKNNSVMPWTTFAGMDDFDLKAIYAYLRTLKPVNNKVVKNPG